MHTDPLRHDHQYRNSLNEYELLADAFPNTNINLGPGSLALYLGSEPVFHPGTVWFTEVIKNWEDFGPLKFNQDNFWLKRHLALIRRQVELADGEYLIGIPDLLENVDILAAMRGPQNLCFDLMDSPDLIKTYVRQVDDLYRRYFDSFYELVKGPEEDCCYTCFQIWGPGRTAKLQCDFSAMLSPDQFREFVQPSLRRQCRKLDYTLYHLDGPDAVRHVEALMEIEELDALQFTPGAGKPGAEEECWWSPIYDKLKKSNKSIWVTLRDQELNRCVAAADKLVRRYGPDGLYLLFPAMSAAQGRELISKAERDWC
jgi:5-methyltetrahydrofolate--homocysteine methyltransferase